MIRQEMIGEQCREVGLQQMSDRCGTYLPRVRGIEASSVAGYLKGLQACWRRMEAMQESETEKALCRMQQRKLEAKIILWEEAADVDGK